MNFLEKENKKMIVKIREGERERDIYRKREKKRNGEKEKGLLNDMVYH